MSDPLEHEPHRRPHMAPMAAPYSTETSLMKSKRSQKAPSSSRSRGPRENRQPMCGYAIVTAAMGLVGAALTMVVTAHETLAFSAVVWPLAGLLAVLGLYPARAMLGGKM
jgi:hypothetical protein